MIKSLLAFIFMEVDKKNQDNDKYYWRPVMLFYAKTTSWIIFPLFLALLAGKYVTKSFGSQSLFFIFLIAGFLITCWGIYREVRKYKKDLEIEDKNKNGDKSNTK